MKAKVRRPGVLTTGTDRFSCPLTGTEQKKFAMLCELAPHYVLAFTPRWRPVRFKEGAEFYLLPNWPSQRLRQAVFLVLTYFATLYFAIFRGVRVAVSQTVYDALPLILARTTLKLIGLRIAVVVQVHGDWDRGLALLGKVPGPLAPLARATARFTLRRANVVRAISHFTLAKARPYIREGTPVVVFPGFTDIDLFLEAGPPAAEGGLPGFLYAGVLTPLKGVSIAVGALRLLRDQGVAARLVVAGEGPDRERLQRQARDLGLDGSVSFVGFVDQKRLRRLMQESAALVLPTLSEGFGRVVIEAMASRKPVIASKTGGIPELVRDGENGLLASPGDPADLAEKMRSIVEQPEAAEAMGLKGWAFVRERYSNSAYLEQSRRMLELASRSLGRSRAPEVV